jgi:hypothetical protein
MTSRRTDRAVTRPECADGCPLTDTTGCATGCIRAPSVPVGTCECGQGPATLEVVPGYLTCVDCAALWRTRIDPHPVTVLEPGHVGTEPARPTTTPAGEPPVTMTSDDVPMSWAPYVALLAVLLVAAVCAMLGLTKP